MIRYMKQNPGGFYLENSTLEKYFTDEVQVSRQQTTAVVYQVLPKVKEILQYINSKDKHFNAEPVSVGSYTQGLGVDEKRDYDFSVVFQFNPNVEPKALVWNHDLIYPVNYDFARMAKRPVSLFDWIEFRPIVSTPCSLPYPGIGYCQVNSSAEVPGLTFAKSLIPIFVQRKFGLLLQEAIEQMKFSKNFRLSPKLHGPAFTIETEVETDDGKIHPVSIDLAVIIRAELPFLTKMGWPVPYAKWPSPEKIQSIREKGINFVAKKEFFWQLSFAELEKLLVKDIDKDEGCRKKVHRIMKSVLYTVCKEKSTLSTYILKNVWFHECEKYPHPFHWHSDRLSERYLGCLQSLIDCSNNGVLCQYFDRRVNLLQGKNIAFEVEKIRCFDFSPWQTNQR